MVNRSFFYGEGLFETILYKGRTKKLMRHYERLSKSARYFSIPCPDFETFFRKIEAKVKGRKNVYVKVCLASYGGPRHYELPSKGELKISVYKYKPVRDPAHICISRIVRHSSDPTIRHKTLNYLLNLIVKRDAIQRGFYDGLMLNEGGYITECSSANIILVKKGTVYTPHKESGLLFGTTLQTIMDKVKVEEVPLRLDDVFGADHIFLTNSLIGILPVKKLEDRDFPINWDLALYLKKLIEEENVE
ncbi:aminotransferase class IV [Hydrogenobacter thermophilus]|uniref:aminotransferase class IV n=1 Tax=Hydrogenobacter thermophilus TaxID=940 RepID=UPI0030F4CE11